MYAPSRTSTLGISLLAGALLVALLLAFAAATGSLIIIIGLVALAFACAIVGDWVIGVPILLFVSATDGFIKHYSPDSALVYILKDLVLVLIGIGLTIRMALRPQERPDRTRWRGLLAWSLYFAFLVTQLLHPATTFAGGMGAFRSHGAFALLYVIGAVYFQQRDRLTSAANIVLGLCTFVALATILELAMGQRWMHISPGFLKVSLHYASFPSAAARAAGATGASFRMYGTLVDPAALGVCCTFGILTGIAALSRLHGIWRILALIAVPLMGVALVLSQTRAAMAGLGAGIAILAVLLLVRRETRVLAVAGLLSVGLAVPIGILATNGRIVDRLFATDAVAYAANTRDVSRAETLYQLPRFPWGHGLGSTGAGGNLRDSSGLAIDNVYFSTLYETGIVGLAALLILQGTMLYLGLRATLRAKSVAASTVFAGIVAGQVSLLTASWFMQGAFDYAPASQFFWLFTGAIARSDSFI